MSTTTISALPQTSSLGPTDVGPWDVGGATTMKVTLQNMFQSIPTGSAVVPSIGFSGLADGLYSFGAGFTGLSSAGLPAIIFGILNGNAYFQGRTGESVLTNAVNNSAVTLLATNAFGLTPAIKLSNSQIAAHTFGNPPFVSVTQAYSQSLGAGYTLIQGIATETALGSGSQLLMDLQAGASPTSKFKVTNDGRVMASGNGAGITPTYSTIAFPNCGFNFPNAGSIWASLNGATNFAWSISGNTSQFYSISSIGDFTISNQQTQTTARLVLANNNGSDVYSTPMVVALGQALWTGSTQFQRAFGFLNGVSQSNTASWSAIEINTSLAASGLGSAQPVFGSGGGFALRVRTGGTSPVEQYALTHYGQPMSAAITPVQLVNGNIDNYAGAAGYALARLKPDSVVSIIRGILAPAPVLGAILTIVNLGNGAGTLTVNNQDAGSAATNRIQTKSGGATIISTNGVMTLQYDPVDAFWRQIS